MTAIRPPAVAGLFYPAAPETLRFQVCAYLAAAAPATTETPPKALIVPHAGYPYSGPIAASAYALLAQRADTIRRVVLLGPAHRWFVPGMAYPQSSALATPLGTVPIDRDALAYIAHLPQVQALDAAFTDEHCLEVQLPFLQIVLSDFRLVPLLVGAADTENVAAVLAALWGEEETLILISSDLSHYLDYTTAQHLDARTSQAILALRPEAIAPDQACGARPIAGLLREAQRRGLRARLLDLRNSGDTAGPRDRVVGYGAYAFA